MYQINLSNQARKSLRKLDGRFRKKFLLMLQLLRDNPLLGEKMTGVFEGSYRIKIPPVRIIYAIDMKNKIIWVRAIGHRGDVYKKN